MSRLTGMFPPFARLQDEMNRLFDEFVGDTPERRPYGLNYPALNAWEEGDSAWLEAELPGLSLNDIEVTVTGNEVTITGERKFGETQGARWHRQERSQGRFARRLTLPWEIDSAKVEAKLHDGVLTLKLPKSEAARPRKIKVLPA